LFTFLVIYNGTQYAGLQNDIAYATADLTFLTLNYDLFDNFPLDICSQTYIEANASNTDACPGDGTYYFKLQYELPSTDNTKSWFASGWKGSGEITFYSEQTSSSSKVADCKLLLGTSVSAAQDSNFRAPSAAITSLVVILLAVLVALLSLYVACRRRKPRVDKEDLISFHRMNDDVSSKQPNSLA
jgi:hypothetical protein